MSDLMTHAVWLKMTDGGTFAIRSSRLKAVDRALANYHSTPNPDNHGKVHGALLAWMSTKNDWTGSVRNRRDAVQTLLRQLEGTARTGVSKEQLANYAALSELPFFEHDADLDARLFVAEHRKEIVKVLFGDAQMQTRFAKVAATGQALGTALADLGKATTLSAPGVGAGSGTISSAMKFAEDFVAGLCDLSDSLKAEVMAELTKMVPGFMSQLARQLTPIVGTLASGSDVFKKLGTAVSKEYERRQSTGHRIAVLPGAPRDAVNAMLVMMEQARNEALRDASIAAVKVTVEGILTATGAGAALTVGSGVGFAIVNLGLEIKALVGDVQEKNEINALLKTGDFSLKVFEVSPVLGAYLIACADTSDVINMMTEDFGREGWKQEVEMMKSKHLDNLVKSAQALIFAHRFVLVSIKDGVAMEFKAGKGLVPGGFIEKRKHHLKKKIARGLGLAAPIGPPKGHTMDISGMGSDAAPKLERQNASRKLG